MLCSMNKHLFSTWKSICFCNLFLLTVGLQVVFQSIWNTTSGLSSRTNLAQHKWQGPILTSQGLRDWKPKPTWWPPIGHPHSHHPMLVTLGHKRPCLNSGLSHAVSATMRNNTPISNIVWQTQSVIPDSDHWINILYLAFTVLSRPTLLTPAKVLQFMSKVLQPCTIFCLTFAHYGWITLQWH